MQLFVCDMARGLIDVIRLKNDCGLICTRGKVSVDTIGRHVERTVSEPVD